MHEILGQTRALDQLQAALTAQRVPHAYIFHGPAGVGKCTAAFVFAKIILCHQPQRDLAGRVEACGACPSCRLLAKASDVPDAQAANHPDFHLIVKELAFYSDDKATRDRKLLNIPVEVLRQTLIEPVYRAAQFRHGKVFVVDEAELIDARAGQNALLKTLEEPPAGTIIILVTASVDRLLPTIRSRCRQVAFAALSDDVIRQWADRAAPDLSADDRRWLVQFAAGSIGRAVIARDYGLSSWSRGILPAIDQLASGKCPPGLGSQMVEAIDSLAEEWVKRHKNASKDAANKMAAKLMWSMIAQHARTRLAEIAARQKPADPDRAEPAAAPWLGVIDALVRAEGELASNVNLGIVADHAVAGMLHPTPELAAW